MKLSKKIDAALARRKKAFVQKMPDSGQICHMPGSRNHKKGAGIPRPERGRRK